MEEKKYWCILGSGLAVENINPIRSDGVKCDLCGHVGNGNEVEAEEGKALG